jgi:hypothetical protein
MLNSEAQQVEVRQVTGRINMSLMKQRFAFTHTILQIEIPASLDG